MIVLVYIVIGLLGLYLFLRSGKRNGKPIPGPKGWPVVGLGFEITQQNMYFKFSQYAQKYGNLFKLKVYGNNIVVLNSAELIRTAFNTDPYRKFMNDRVTTFYGDDILFGSQSICFMERAYGSKHGELRKGFTRAIHMYGEGKKEFENMVHSELSRLVGKIESHQGRAFDIEDLIKRCLENIISIILSGHELKTEDDFKAFWDFDRANDFLLNQRVDVLMRMFPFLRHIPSVYRDRYDEIVNAKNALTKMFFTEAKDTYRPGVIRGIVDVMIKEQLQSQQSRESDYLFNDERIISTILETIAAGVLTTFTNLSSTFLILVNHPEYQAKIQQEIDRVIGRDRLPSLDDKARCPFVEAVSLETHRYVPVLPGLLYHVCKSDLEFEGYHIPKNSAIVPNIFHVHHDEKIWGDPWNFRPERFLDENGELLPNDHPFRKSWLAFGTGRRQCIAETLARSRVFLVVTTLLQRWTFELPTGNHVPCDPRVGDYDFNLNCRPKAFNCRAVPRSSAKEA